MALSPIQLKPKRKGGKGGLIGKIAGGIIGAIGGALAPATGGTSALAGAAAGSALGGTAGGLVGEAADPLRETGGKGVGTLSRVSKVNPEVMVAQIADGQRELARLPDVSATEKQTLIDQMEEAKRKQMAMLGRT